MSDNVPNSEILFIYEAKMCNPNGDPDDENRPRMDYKTSRNLVSDVRLKRFFRDYIINKFGEEFIWVTKVNNKNVSSDERIELLNIKDPNEILKSCIDARLFGATVPIRAKKEKTRGESESFIGPVQFTWGISFNHVELVKSSSITSLFRGREGKGEKTYGTIGKDWRLYYSLLGFYGVISGHRAKSTGMDIDDIKILDNFLWKAVYNEATTRSKIGEKPLLYLRIEYKDADTVIGDFRRYVNIDEIETVRDLKDLKLDFEPLINVLKENIDFINKIYIMAGEETESVKRRFIEEFGTLIQFLPHDIPNPEKYLKRK